MTEMVKQVTDGNKKRELARPRLGFRAATLPQTSAATALGRSLCCGMASRNRRASFKRGSNLTSLLAAQGGELESVLRSQDANNFGGDHLFLVMLDWHLKNH